MATPLSNSLLLSKTTSLHLSSGSCLKSIEQSVCPTKVCFNRRHARNPSTSRSSFAIQSQYSDDGRSSSAGIFVGGFVLGGLVVGALGCVFAPQISKALAGADRKDLMRKLPKFLYDEEKVLEKQRKILAEKIEQLNSAIDDISAQLRSEDNPNGAAVNTDEVESAV
ncbi:PREDICTED: uncharacterized protein LOC109181962 isoform X2 [Ipomoea nil]|uniref:uncharacterized protein LOC109181962 isoform X2 n=1 Tax=Ipomoea nil TaxID=35883 RepID=UPI0009011FF3|nr:PREDICTED: uncharacterized protein LOC109181962 isoform X2 [Ipomoea nil]